MWCGIIGDLYQPPCLDDLSLKKGVVVGVATEVRVSLWYMGRQLEGGRFKKMMLPQLEGHLHDVHSI